MGCLYLYTIQLIGPLPECLSSFFCINFCFTSTFVLFIPLKHGMREDVSLQGGGGGELRWCA